MTRSNNMGCCGKDYMCPIHARQKATRECVICRDRVGLDALIDFKNTVERAFNTEPDAKDIMVLLDVEIDRMTTECMELSDDSFHR